MACVDRETGNTVWERDCAAAAKALSVDLSDVKVSFSGQPQVGEGIVLVPVQTGPKRLLLTVHNPTDEPMTCTLERSPFFTLSSQCPGPLDVPAGDQVVVDIGEMKILLVTTLYFQHHE